MYSEKDFKDCAFNPMADEQMLAKYPKLMEAVKQEWGEDDYIDNLLRYVIICYDPKSPVVINERDLNYRKTVSVELAGFDMENADLLKQVYECSYWLLPDLIMTYLVRYAKTKEWAALIVIENCYWEAVKHLMQPISGDSSKAVLEAVQKKSALKDELDKDIARLERYQKAFFGEDDVMTDKLKRRSFSSPEKVLKNQN